MMESTFYWSDSYFTVRFLNQTSSQQLLFQVMRLALNRGKFMEDFKICVKR